MFTLSKKLLKTTRLHVVLPLVSLAAFLPQSSDAQIWKNMGKKIEKKVEDQASRRLERRIDKGIDKAFDGVEGAADDAVKSDKSNDKSKSSKKSNSKSDSRPTNQPESNPQAASSAAAVALPTSTNAAAIADSYQFDLGVTYEMTQTKGKKQEKMPGTTLWISKADYVGMSSSMQKNMFMVLDGTSMLAFMEDKKTYMSLGGAMAKSIVGAAETEAEKESAEFSIKKVGSETILEYPCEIYELTTQEGKMKIWVTNAIGFDGGSFMKAFSTLAKNSRSTIPGLSAQAPGGLMLKMESTDAKKNETVTMLATDVHKDGKTLNTKEYKSMGGF